MKSTEAYRLNPSRFGNFTFVQPWFLGQVLEVRRANEWHGALACFVCNSRGLCKRNLAPMVWKVSFWKENRVNLCVWRFWWGRLSSLLFYWSLNEYEQVEGLSRMIKGLQVWFCVSFWLIPGLFNRLILGQGAVDTRPWRQDFKGRALGFGLDSGWTLCVLTIIHHTLAPSWRCCPWGSQTQVQDSLCGEYIVPIAF